MSLANWGKNYTPPSGLDLYICTDPIIDSRPPIETKRDLIEGIYWFDDQNNKMWFNLNGQWVHYDPLGTTAR